ncbi:MAG: helix-turn-helix domain-containing protein [Thermoguttaceae bacterium]
MELYERERDSGTIIDELRQAIAASGLTVYRIAKGTGVSPGVLSRFVRGERSLTMETAAKLCTFLNLHLVKVP